MLFEKPGTKIRMYLYKKVQIAALFVKIVLWFARFKPKGLPDFEMKTLTATIKKRCCLL